MAQGVKFEDPEERARSNRVSWTKSRARTGNVTSRAYNLAIQDCGRYMRENLPHLWKEFYAERLEEQRLRVEGPVHSEDGESRCMHNEIEEIEVTLHSLKCKGCGSILGSTVEGQVPEGYQVFTGDGGRVAYRRTA